MYIYLCIELPGQEAMRVVCSYLPDSLNPPRGAPEFQETYLSGRTV